MQDDNGCPNTCSCKCHRKSTCRTLCKAQSANGELSGQLVNKCTCTCL